MPCLCFVLSGYKNIYIREALSNVQTRPGGGKHPEVQKIDK